MLTMNKLTSGYNIGENCGKFLLWTKDIAEHSFNGMLELLRII